MLQSRLLAAGGHVCYAEDAACYVMTQQNIRSCCTQPLVPDYADINGAPCTVYFDTQPQATAVNTNSTLPRWGGA